MPAFKIIFLFIFLLFSIKQLCVAQTFELYTGANLCSGNVIREYTDGRLSNRKLPFRILPAIGYRLNFKIEKNVKLFCGLEYNKIGANQFYMVSKPLLDSINFDDFVELSQMKLPIGISYGLHKGFALELGYVFSYTFDKNTNFIFIEDYANTIWKSTYKKFSHLGSIGLKYNVKSFNFRFIFNYAFTPIYDSGKNFKFDPSIYLDLKRELMSINYANVSIGYQIK
jgi:hypothetical protein